MSFTLWTKSVSFEYALDTAQATILDTHFLSHSANRTFEYHSVSFHSILGPVDLFIWGKPFFPNNLTPEQYFEQVIVSHYSPELLSNIDGAFFILIYQHSDSSIYAINDRFNSINIFYSYVQGVFRIDSLYYDHLIALKRRSLLSWSSAQMYSFLRFNRLFGTDTYDFTSKFLSPSTLLHLKGSTLSLTKYWIPSFKKNHKLTLKKSLSNYSKYLRHSTDRLASPTMESTLFLSSGHDSRAILASATHSVSCLTVGYSQNLEASCAKQLAQAKSSPFSFITLSKSHLSDNYVTCSILNAGSHSILDSFFVGLSLPARLPKPFLHGHGLDYMFNGMYLPYTFLRFFSFTLLYRIPASLFRRRSPVRTIYHLLDSKLTHPIKNKLFSPFCLHQTSTSLVDHLSAIVDTFKIKTADDLSDALLVAQLGRHYSRVNIDTKQLHGVVRTPSFSNQLFDFFLSLPIRFRRNGLLVSYFFKNCSLGSIPTGNWGFPASFTALQKTQHQILRKISNTFHLPFTYLQGPTAADRTWPDQASVLRTHPELYDLVKNSLRSHQVRLLLPQLNWDYIDESLEYLSSNDSYQLTRIILSTSALAEFINQVESNQSCVG